MTPEQKIKHALILLAVEESEPLTVPITENNVDELYEDFDLGDILYEFRQGEVETNILAPSSRIYESRSVAAKMPDGSWVGWTYWYGGGKHGEPESIDWMEDAYDLNVREEEKMVIVRTFSLKEKTDE